jgi:hypothetical protein
VTEMTFPACQRCRKLCPVEPENVAHKFGDPALPVVLVPPLGWLTDPGESTAIICGDCASPAEIAAYMRLLEMVASFDPLGFHGR